MKIVLIFLMLALFTTNYQYGQSAPSSKKLEKNDTLKNENNVEGYTIDDFEDIEFGSLFDDSLYNDSNDTLLTQVSIRTHENESKAEDFCSKLEKLKEMNSSEWKGVNKEYFEDFDEIRFSKKGAKIEFQKTVKNKNDVLPYYQEKLNELYSCLDQQNLIQKDLDVYTWTESSDIIRFEKKYKTFYFSIEKMAE